MECGRCQDACPAFASGKPLSPKMIIFDMESTCWRGRGESGRAREKPCRRSFRRPYRGRDLGLHDVRRLHARLPGEIEHIPKIVRTRQARVLMESAFPAELNGFFRNMETNANPWGVGFSKRGDWAAAMGVPTLADHPGAEYLFWVGCAGSFDEKGQATAAPWPASSSGRGSTSPSWARRKNAAATRPGGWGRSTSSRPWPLRRSSSSPAAASGRS